MLLHTVWTPAFLANITDILRCACWMRADHFSARARLEQKEPFAPRCGCSWLWVVTHLPGGYCLLRRVLTALTYLLSPCVCCNHVNRLTGGEARWQTTNHTGRWRCHRANKRARSSIKSRHGNVWANPIVWRRGLFFPFDIFLKGCHMFSVCVL